MIRALASVLFLACLLWTLARFEAVRPLLGIWLPCAAFALGCAGFVRRFWQWAATPVPFPIPVSGGSAGSADAPLTRLGAALRLAGESVLFRSLWRNTHAAILREGTPRLGQYARKGLWLGCFLFHAGLFFVVLRHTRLWLDPVPGWLAVLENADTWLAFGQPTVFLSGLILTGALCFLLARRALPGTTRRISLPSDFFFLLLILSIALSGLALRHVWRADLTTIKLHMLSLARIDPDSRLLAECSPLFFVHLDLACLLFAMLPFSNLLHGPGLLLNPTRTLPSNTRAVRYGSGWRASANPAFAPQTDRPGPAVNEEQI